MEEGSETRRLDEVERGEARWRKVKRDEMGGRIKWEEG